MRADSLQPGRIERAKAVVAAVAVNMMFGVALLIGLALHGERSPEAILQTFNVARAPAPPPPPPPHSKERSAKPAHGDAGAKAIPSAIVAPPTKIPPQQEIVAATVAGNGTAASGGSAMSGTGTGGGGSGNGAGAGGGSRTGARLISGGLTNRDYRAIAGVVLQSGSGVYILLVNPAGRVERCRPATSSGSLQVDQSVCAMLSARLIFRPAMEDDGRPIYQDVNYVARWGR